MLDIMPHYKSMEEMQVSRLLAITQKRPEEDAKPWRKKPLTSCL